MNLELNKLIEKIQGNDFVKNFLKELCNYMEKNNNTANKNIDNIELTQDEEIELYRKKWDFLENYFDKELQNLTNGETFIVTDKFENDPEYHRYKIAQYKDNKEYKYVTLKKDLPEDIKIGDVIRKKDTKYIIDNFATKYVKKSLNKIKEDIISKREN